MVLGWLRDGLEMIEEWLRGGLEIVLWLRWVVQGLVGTVKRGLEKSLR